MHVFTHQMLALVHVSNKTHTVDWKNMSVYAHFLRGGSKYNADIVKDVNQILLVYYLV